MLISRHVLPLGNLGLTGDTGLAKTATVTVEMVMGFYIFLCSRLEVFQATGFVMAFLGNRLDRATGKRDSTHDGLCKGYE